MMNWIERIFYILIFALLWWRVETTRYELPDSACFRYLSIREPDSHSAITLQVGTGFAGINITDGDDTKSFWVEKE